MGEPGVGKTTVMGQLCRKHTVGPDMQLRGLLWGQPLLLEDEWVGIRLGRDRAQFSGTDALGMAVNPDAVTWVEKDPLPPLIVGEGARLANERFLNALSNRSELLVVLLRAKNAAERREERGSQQNPSWIRGRATASRNLFDKLAERGFASLELNNTWLKPLEAATIIEREAGIE